MVQRKMISAVATSPRLGNLFRTCGLEPPLLELLALETQNYQLQQLVKNHNKPSAIT